MSSTRTRDWVCDQTVNAWLWSLPNVAKTKIDPDALNEVLNHVESIVRRELAAEVEKMIPELVMANYDPIRNARHMAIQDVLALLSPHQNDAEGGE